LFCELPAPTAEHFTDFIYFYRQSDVLFVIQRFIFPKNHQKYFERVSFSDRQMDK